MTDRTCMIDECDRPVVARNLCSGHWTAMSKVGRLDEFPRMRHRKVCTVDGCERSAFGYEMCQLHYMRWRTHGTTDKRLPALSEHGTSARYLYGCRCEPCKDARSVYQREWKSRVPAEVQRWQRIWRRYRLTPEDFYALLDQQGGGCAICGAEAVSWHVDHCHRGDFVRGILCSPCNQGLGYYSDDPDRMQSAVNYLRRHATAADASAICSPADAR